MENFHNLIFMTNVNHYKIQTQMRNPCLSNFPIPNWSNDKHPLIYTGKTWKY